MGACTSANKNETIVDKNLLYDFETYREKMKESGDNKIFEVKAKLWELSLVNKKIKKTLLSKYLFFKPNGKFESRIKKASGEEMWIEGVLEKTGDIKFTYKQRVIDNNSTKSKIYEGKFINSEKGLVASGKIFESDNKEEEKTLKNETFILDFSNVLWKVEYTLKNAKVPNIINAFIFYKNGIFSGISFDDKGFSTWAGIEKNDNKVTLIQQYLDKSHTAGSEKGVFSYSGFIDKISFIIDGTVNNEEIENSSINFVIKRVGKLYKGSLEKK